MPLLTNTRRHYGTAAERAATTPDADYVGMIWEDSDTGMQWVWIGSSWAALGARVLGSARGGASECYALCAIRSGGTDSISAAPVNALTAAGFTRCEVRIDSQINGSNQVINAGEVVYVGWSETSGDWAAIATDVDDAIAAHAVAATSRTGANSFFTNVRYVRTTAEILTIEASPGNHINELVLKTNAAATDYGVTVFAEL